MKNTYTVSAVCFVLKLMLPVAVLHAETYNYSCEVNGKTYPLRVDDNKNILEWRGRRYILTEQPDCAKYGWHAKGDGASFDFCTATKGYAAIKYKDKNDEVECNQKR